jgi:hypothetical protein
MFLLLFKKQDIIHIYVYIDVFCIKKFGFIYLNDKINVNIFYNIFFSSEDLIKFLSNHLK